MLPRSGVRLVETAPVADAPDQRHRHRRHRHQQRHRGDVDEARPVAQPLDVLAQGQLDVPQLAPRVEQLAAEAVDLLALGIAEQRGVLALADLQRAQLALQLVQPLQQLLLLGAVLRLAARRISATWVNGRTVTSRPRRLISASLPTR